MKKICFYYHHINSAGGVEIAIINLIEQIHKEYDITIAYSATDSSIEKIDSFDKRKSL